MMEIISLKSNARKTLTSTETHLNPFQKVISH